MGARGHKIFGQVSALGPFPECLYTVPNFIKEQFFSADVRREHSESTYSLCSLRIIQDRVPTPMIIIVTRS